MNASRLGVLLVALATVVHLGVERTFYPAWLLCAAGLLLLRWRSDAYREGAKRALVTFLTLVTGLVLFESLTVGTAAGSLFSVGGAAMLPALLLLAVAVIALPAYAAVPIAAGVLLLWTRPSRTLPVAVIALGVLGSAAARVTTGSTGSAVALGPLVVSSGLTVVPLFVAHGLALVALARPALRGPARHGRGSAA